MPGRTDNEIKNYWRTHFKKKEKSTQKQEKRKHQLQLQQQQQQEYDMKNVLSQAAETSSEKMSESEGRQQMVLTNPNSEEQCMSVMYQDVASWLDTVGDDGISGGLWNLADDYTVAWIRQLCATN